MSSIPVEERTHDEIEMDLVVHLSTRPWFDVTEGHNPDPTAIQCFATGYTGKRNGDTIWMLTRYEDDGEPLALVCSMRGESKRITVELFKLEWLWEQITSEKTPEKECPK
jgi:hypothetical protein